MNRQALAAELIAEEGLRLKPYRCSEGALTIGVGRNLDARGISEAEARFMLANDMEQVWRDVTTALPWVTRMTDARQRVVAQMAFQLGISGLLRFKRALEAMQAERYEEAAAEMLDSRWAQQTPARAKRLAKVMRAG